MFEDEIHNKITFKHQDVYSANVFRNLKGHSGRKFFCLIFSQIILTHLNTNFTKLPNLSFLLPSISET